MSAVRLALATLAATALAFTTFAFVLLVGMTTASAAPQTATGSVAIVNFAFVPAAINIRVGDSVRWTNQDDTLHSAKANDGSWMTPTLSPGQSASVTFSAAGSFAYQCGIHGASMSGTVVVAAATPSPTPTPPPTPVPTPQPTPVPTPVPTRQPTPQPTLAPTPASTASPTLAPTASPSPSPTAAPVIAPAPTTNAPVAAASSTPAVAPAPAATSDSGPGPLLVAIGAVVVVGLAGLAFALSRR